MDPIKLNKVDIGGFFQRPGPLQKRIRCGWMSREGISDQWLGYQWVISAELINQGILEVRPTDPKLLLGHQSKGNGLPHVGFWAVFLVDVVRSRGVVGTFSPKKRRRS